MKKCFCLLMAYFFLVSSMAMDSYDTSTGLLKIASVSVDANTYSDVTVSINQVYSTGSAPAIGANDKYKAYNGTLTIPVVEVNGTLYYNALVGIGSIVSVGGGPYLQQFTVSGVVSGLNLGQTLNLTNNTTDYLGVQSSSNSQDPSSNTGSANFFFQKPIPFNGDYAVMLAAPVAGQVCTVSNGAGSRVTSNVSNVSILCSAISQSFTLGGTLTGLSIGQSVSLLLNGTNQLVLNQSGGFKFPQSISAGSDYLISIEKQPLGQVCTVNNGIGSSIKSNVASISVVCSSVSYPLSGTVTGLQLGQQLTLLLNGQNALWVGPNTGFTFSTRVSYGGNYTVTIGSQPLGLSCTITNGAQTNLQAPVTNINVSCAPVLLEIGGTLSGLSTDAKLVLSLNQGSGLTLSGDGNFTFPNTVAYGDAFQVALQSQPAGQSCAVSNGSSPAIFASVKNVSVLCTVTVPVVSTLQFFLYGGPSSNVYLGCVSCKSSQPDSICNSNNPYGNASSALSIWNPSGTYGSVSSAQSPWNVSAANQSPIVLDNNSFNYGYFTVNTAQSGRVQNSFLTAILSGFISTKSLNAVRTQLCG